MTADGKDPDGTTPGDKTADDKIADDHTVDDSDDTASEESGESAETVSAATGRRRDRGGRDGRRRTTPTGSGDRTTVVPDQLRSLRLIRGSDVKAGALFVVGGVRNLLARPLTSFHLIVSITVFLVGFGLMMVLSASGVEGYAKDGSAYSMFTTQVMFVCLGLVLFYVAARIRVRTLFRLAVPTLAVAIILLILVLIPGIGVAGGGAQRWVSVAGLTFQPSELAKLALCLWGAAVLSTRNPKTATIWSLLNPLVLVAFVMGLLVLLERNQSTTMILGMIVATLLWFGGMRGRYFAAFIGAFVTIGAVLALMWSYRAARVFSFLNGNKDVLGSGYQANQAKFALADGGALGKGLGMGTAKWNYLPNAHNDFIFAVIGEEFGLLGGLSVLGIYVLLGYVGLRIAKRSVDPFLRLLSATITVLFLTQAFINIGYVVGLLPVTGIQLPILSYGGSSALAMLAMLGMLANAARHEPEAVAALSGPAPRGLSRLLRLPRPEGYRDPSATPRRRPTPERSTASSRRRPAPAPARRRTAEPRSGEIHYRARGARSVRSREDSRSSTPRSHYRAAGRGEWENGRW